MEPKVPSLVHYVRINELTSDTYELNQLELNGVNPLLIMRMPTTKDCKLQGTTSS